MRDKPLYELRSIGQFSCINAVQTRAERYFINVGRYTPNAAVHGDSGWTPPIIEKWKSVTNFWYRLQTQEEKHSNHKVYKLADSLGGWKCKNWSFCVKAKFQECGIESNASEFQNKQMIPNRVQGNMWNNYKEKMVLSYTSRFVIKGTGAQ